MGSSTRAALTAEPSFQSQQLKEASAGVRKYAHSSHGKTLAQHGGSCLSLGFNSPCTSLDSLKTDG